MSGDCDAQLNQRPFGLEEIFYNDKESILIHPLLRQPYGNSLKMFTKYYGVALMVVVVMLLHVYELWFIYHSSLPLPSVSSVEVFLGPSFTQAQNVDAVIRVQGENTRTTAWMISFDINHAKCAYFSQHAAAEVMQYGGDIEVRLSSSADQFYADVYAANTQFGNPRSIVWDIYETDDITSLISFNCSIGSIYFRQHIKQSRSLI